MLKISLLLFAKFVIVLGAVFGIHLLTLNQMGLPVFAHKITLSYILNTLLAASILLILLNLKDKLKHIMGFLFLGGTLLKFVMFFVVFYPYYKLDNTISVQEGTSFFIPYVVCLFIETLWLSKALNKD